MEFQYMQIAGSQQWPSSICPHDFDFQVDWRAKIPHSAQASSFSRTKFVTFTNRWRPRLLSSWKSLLARVHLNRYLGYLSSSLVKLSKKCAYDSLLSMASTSHRCYIFSLALGFTFSWTRTMNLFFPGAFEGHRGINTYQIQKLFCELCNPGLMLIQGIWFHIGSQILTSCGIRFHEAAGSN
jgi:hypothetical protein